MSYTVLNVLQDIGALVAQDTSAPTGTDLTNQINYVNMAQLDWASYYKWNELRTPYAVPSLAFSQTSMAVPSNFARLSSKVWDYSTGVDSPTEYPELIRPQDRYLKNSTAKYVWVGGNDISGRYLNINPPLASGASLRFDYQATPSSLATTNDTVTCPDRSYMAARSEYYLLAARSDERFPLFKSSSEDYLAGMVEEQDTPSEGAVNQVPDRLRLSGFRIGQ